ncbi:glycosyltransferase [Sporosarcina sp. ANT_H38]|uniref:glycosyltransferase n=1 Tax=Sporosarcina sp. ANT_H38 TaxID=2597358 RepID=UPI0011F0A7DC|nr:glycosyltransferase [Sporosarcina sp. ANT_H38]KAA0944215.1 glycosyltransferase [Sporosarcina sp. ANT_H38]
MSILVSINCITFNQEHYIVDAIESFLMQKTNFIYEILIGEDCSTDSTKEIVEKYVIKFPKKIRLITSETNVGGRQNSIRLQRESKGKYIALCEGDDYWIDPYKLQKQVDYMEANPECTLCFHASEIIQAPNKRTGRFVKPYNMSKVSPTEDIIVGGGGFCDTATLLYPKILMENPPDFYLNAPVGDYPMQMFLASQGYAYYIDECMSAYRRDVEGSWSSRMNEVATIKENSIKVNEGILHLLDEFNKYTNEEYNNEIEKIKRKLVFELHVLKGRKSYEKTLAGELDWSFKMKIRTKILIKCHFPNHYKKIVGFKDTKIIKMLMV